MEHNFWKDKKVLVTGTHGFIGSHFVKILQNKEARVVEVFKGKIDLLQYAPLVDISKNIDVIINCAALDGNSEFKMEHSAQILDQNSRIVSNILNAAKENGVQDVVLMSSAEIYPAAAISPIKEEDDYRKLFDYSENGYVLSKRYTEILANLYRKQYSMRIFLPRPTNVYGPGDKFDNSNRVIPSLIKKISGDETVEIWGDGSQIRGFIYVSDLVTATLGLVEKNTDHIVNIATDESITILSLTKLIGDICKKQPKIAFFDKSVGVQKRVLDVTKLKSIYPFTPKTLQQGLEETISWYNNNS